MVQLKSQYSIYEKKFNSKALTGNRIVDKNVIIKRLDSYNSDIEEIDTILFKIILKLKKK